MDRPAMAWALVLLATGCGAATPLEGPDAGRDGDATVTPAGPGPFEGTWVGTATVASTQTNPPGSAMMRTTELEFVVSTAPALSGADMILAFADMGGRNRCALVARRSGDRATVPVGTSCTVPLEGSMGGMVSFTVLRGAASVTGGTLVVDLGLDSTATVGAMRVAATLTVSFSGRRR